MKKLCLSVLFLLSNLLVTEVHASSVFLGTSAMTFGLSGDLAEIAVATSGGYSDLGTIPAGDSSVLPNYHFADLSNAGFTLGFQVNDSLGDSPSSVFQSNFVLNFSNSGNVTKQFSLNFDYTLQATVSGEYAEGQLQLEYGLTGYDEVYVEIFGQPSLSVNGNSGAINFSLDAGQSADFEITVRMTSTLLGTTPVPVPPSFALFSAALIVCRKVWRLK